MDIGEKIFELRKNARISQEQLAEKLDITRQTISNWELGQTVPDIIQAKKISQIFSISLDELTDNNVKDILVERVSKTETSVAKFSRILKRFLIAIICCIILIISFIILFTIKNRNEDLAKQIQEKSYREQYYKNLQEEKFYCTINNQEYIHTIRYNEDYYPVETYLDLVSEELNSDDIFYGFIHQRYERYTDARKLITDLKEYYENNGGTWTEVK